MSGGKNAKIKKSKNIMQFKINQFNKKCYKLSDPDNL
jgi:hypothetical protein